MRRILAATVLAVAALAGIASVHAGATHAAGGSESSGVLCCVPH